MSRKHVHRASLEWTGNRGTGTSAYRAYDRTWDLCTPGKPVVSCSNDPALGGDPSKYNPEDMLVAALSSCHMLWYLHLCANAGVVVVAYGDEASGEMAMHRDGSGEFTSVTLRPSVTIAQGSDMARARALHGEVHKFCFIARSVNFPVNVEPQIAIAAP
ncbi:MAG: OsmC family protein [Nitratireductor sp.]|jgi:organic hydroperoxide reductase OsmC/OhrA|nr:OsmC family protein [Nitratireductor sp.]